MKIRKYTIEDGSVIIDAKGEFIHINDIRLLLKDRLDSLHNQLEYARGDETEWGKKNLYSKETSITLLTEIYNEIAY